MQDKEVTIEEFNIDQLNSVFIANHAADPVNAGTEGYYEVRPVEPGLGYCMFSCRPGPSRSAFVVLSLEGSTLRMTCDCKERDAGFCSHQVRVLYEVMRKDNLRIFFDARLRREKMLRAAVDYGLEQEPDLDRFFEVHYHEGSAEIRPLSKALFKINSETTSALAERLLPVPKAKEKTRTRKVIVFRKHKYYRHLYIELYEAEENQQGNIKNPLVLVNPMDLIWKVEDKDELKFYSAVSKFQNNYEPERSGSDMEALKALTKNPLGLEVFEHSLNAKIVSTSSLSPVNLKALTLDIRISVDQNDVFYEIAGQLYLEDHSYNLENLQLKYDYFLYYNNTLYLIDNPDFLKMIDFFKQHNNRILIHQSKFPEFQENILARLEDRILVSYSYLRPATAKQLEEGHFDLPNEQLIYLSDEGDYILLTPVVRYGGIEVPVLSKKTIYSIDRKGAPYMVNRDEYLELALTSVLIRQHPHFEEQLDHNHFYLHKSRFLDNGWFLEAFEEWKAEGIAVLGFNELKNNKLNPHKAKIEIKVLSGLDWFETSVGVRFGKEKVSLKYLHKSIRNKSKFVQLDDGTLGILPEDWIEKFSEYFNSGEVSDELIRTPKSNFIAIAELYEDEFLSGEVKLELAKYQSRLSGFDAIVGVKVPDGFHGELRSYQLHGLNWLIFLDEFGFGGCLADDMGLGKTIQIIAFILLQKEQGRQASLIVMPTTLISNWQTELAKFAPSLKVHTVYGAARAKDTEVFSKVDVVLTSYGTLLYDISFMKKFIFNYVFFDESQAVKNPSSQRYQAAALLKSRNKIVVTGTPVENSTFDLYGQLSLASPGLLGSRQYFKDHYSTPIDKFKDIKRSVELQKRVRPFILRRTKKQVARELPDKTEMVLYCEMGEEQKKVYDSYKNEYRNFLLTHKEEDLSKYSMHVLKGMTQLRQICNSPALLKEEDVFYGDASSKIAVLMEEIEMKVTQHKILVFSQFVGMLDLIRKELRLRNIAFEYLTGQSVKRAEKVSEFQNNESVRVFLISLKTGGVGLNLTEADYVYLVDPWWNPAAENQAIDRSYRIGQKKNVIAVRLICPGTIEEKIMRLQEHKNDLVNDLIKTDTDSLKQLSKKDLLELFN